MKDSEFSTKLNIYIYIYKTWFFVKWELEKVCHGVLVVNKKTNLM